LSSVIGVLEAAVLTACMLGGRFQIVTFASLRGEIYLAEIEPSMLTKLAPL
jgi:Asp/Glu/hydantoin racemase